LTDTTNPEPSAQFKWIVDAEPPSGCRLVRTDSADPLTGSIAYSTGDAESLVAQHNRQVEQAFAAGRAFERSQAKGAESAVETVPQRKARIAMETAIRWAAAKRAMAMRNGHSTPWSLAVEKELADAVLAYEQSIPPPGDGSKGTG